MQDFSWLDQHNGFLRIFFQCYFFTRHFCCSGARDAMPSNIFFVNFYSVSLCFLLRWLHRFLFSFCVVYYFFHLLFLTTIYIQIIEYPMKTFQKWGNQPVLFYWYLSCFVSTPCQFSMLLENLENPIYFLF